MPRSFVAQAASSGKSVSRAWRDVTLVRTAITTAHFKSDFIRKMGSAGTRTRNQPRKLSGLLYQISRVTAMRRPQVVDFSFASRRVRICGLLPSSRILWWRAGQLSRACGSCDYFHDDVLQVDDLDFRWNRCNADRKCRAKCKHMAYVEMGRPGLEPGTNALKGRCSTD